MVLDRRLRLLQIVLALVGLGAAIYLTYSKYAHEGQCAIAAGCSVVQNSPWSTLFGVPVPVLGIVGYVGILGALLVPQRSDLVRLALVVMSGIGFLFSMFLMYRAYVTLKAFCPFCTTSAVMMTLLAVASVTRYVLGSGPVVAPTPARVSADGTTALVLGILSFVVAPVVLSVPAIVVGFEAQRAGAAMDGRPGHKNATAGLVLGTVSLVLAAIAGVIWLAVWS